MVVTNTSAVVVIHFVSYDLRPIWWDVSSRLFEFLVPRRFSIDAHANPVLEQMDVRGGVNAAQEVQHALLERRMVVISGKHPQQGWNALAFLVGEVAARTSPCTERMGFVGAVMAYDFNCVLHLVPVVSQDHISSTRLVAVGWHRRIR